MSAATILVTGATGLTGKRLVEKLSARGTPVRALVRNRAKAAELAKLPGVEVVEGDMKVPATLSAALGGIERALIISSSSPDMLEVQSTFADAAKAAGVKHLVKLSGIMPEIDSPFRFARMHGLIEKHIEATGVPWTHLRAGEFMHSYFRQVPNITGKAILALPMEEARIACIDTDDIVDVFIAVLSAPISDHAGKIHRITGGEALTMAEVAEKLGRVVGKPIKYVNVAPEDMKKAQLAAGFPPFLVDALQELFAERRRGKESEVFPDTRALLGRAPTTFDAFAARYAAVFRGEQQPPKA